MFKPGDLVRHKQYGTEAVIMSQDEADESWGHSVTRIGPERVWIKYSDDSHCYHSPIEDWVLVRSKYKVRLPD